MHDINFPVDLPQPGTMYGFDLDSWYDDAVNRIRSLILDKAPTFETIEFAWTLKSRLRFAAAMALIDQEVANEFIRDNPLPPIEDLLAVARTSGSENQFQVALKMLLEWRAEGTYQPEIAVVNDVSTYQQTVIQDAQGRPHVKRGDEWQELQPVLPPRPIVPNPEYLGTDWRPFYSTASVWNAAPESIYAETEDNLPCLLVFKDSLWLSYLTHEDDTFAVVRFHAYIEHQETRIGNHLAGHPYFAAGLQPRTFNALSISALTKYWINLDARHWVVNFQDRTIDIIAQQAEVVDSAIVAETSFDALARAKHSHVADPT
jgi:hypothetical protein